MALLYGVLLYMVLLHVVLLYMILLHVVLRYTVIYLDDEDDEDDDDNDGNDNDHHQLSENSKLLVPYSNSEAIGGTLCTAFIAPIILYIIIIVLK